MTARKTVTALFSSLGILILILDGQTALRGASMGLALCIRAVIPSLFPFLFLCSVLTGSLWGSQSPLLRPLCRKLGIPAGAESILLAAWLGGYPAGAQVIGQAYREQGLIRDDAHHLLRFCSNAGPAFLFGMTAVQFSRLSDLWALWLIQISASLLTGFLHLHRPTGPAALPRKDASIPRLLASSVRTMGILCGWILLFRMISEYLVRWFLWYFPSEIQVIFSGILELSNGCCSLSAIPDPGFRFCVCSGLLSFGGICVVMQTASILHGLSIKPYLAGKLIQTALSLVLSLLYLRFGWISFLLPVGFFLLWTKKEVDFPEKPLYNPLIKTRREKKHAVS